MHVINRFSGFLVLLAIVAGPAFAEKSEMTFAIGAGVFTPINSVTRDKFDEAWTRVSITSFEPNKPAKWRFISEVGSYRFNSTTSVSLYPFTVGFERGLGEEHSVRPYVVMRVGPYYGRFQDNAAGIDGNHIGLSTNMSLGLVFSRRYFMEARYDYFSEMAGYDFSGLSIYAGMKLFSIKL